MSQANHPAFWTRQHLGTSLVFLFTALAAGLVLHGMPFGFVSADGVAIALVGTVLFVLLLAAMSAAAHPAVTVMRAGLVLWVFVLISEKLFLRGGSIDTALEGRFAVAAYGEAAAWLMAGAALLVIVIGRPDSLRGLFRGVFLWISLFAGLCVVTSLYAPRPLFSLAWSFKLVVTVALLRVLTNHLRDTPDVRRFLRWSLGSFAVLVVLALALALLYDETPFYAGRVSLLISPTGFSATAGVLPLLALALYPKDRRLWIAALGALGVMLMLVGGGKAAIGAFVISGILFFALQRKLAATAGFAAGMAVLLGIVLVVSPLSEHLRSYRDSGLLTTLTGRTDLWAIAMPSILANPLLGNGYLASRFLEVAGTESLTGAGWEAAHMHNGFLEVLYNNGLLGLALFLPILVLLARNLRRAARRSPELRVLAYGLMSLFVFLLINGLFNASFGGRASGAHILLLALAAVSERLAGNEDPLRP